MDNREKSLLNSLTDQGDQVALKGILRQGAGTQSLHQLPMDSFAFPEFRVQGREAIKPKYDENLEKVQGLQNELANLRRTMAQKDVDAQKRFAEGMAKVKIENLAAGQKDGEAKASKAFATQVTQMQSEVAATLQALNAAYAKRLQDIQAETVELSLGIAKRMFCADAEHNPEHIVTVVSEAFAHLGQAESVILHVHPLDVDYVQEKQSFWQPIHSALKSIRIEGDERITRGGCWIESESGGTIDLRSETLLARVETAVREAYRHNPQAIELPKADA